MGGYLPQSSDPLGIYLSVPFCRSKCTYCNFASGVYSPAFYGRYVESLCREISGLRSRANSWGLVVPERVDSLYLGGGTPSLLPPDLLLQIGRALHQEFDLLKTAEITLECAPGALEDRILQAMLEFGANRLSFGVQSFVDREAAVTGRLHTRSVALADLNRARIAGIARISVDLIAGLPYQTPASWQESLETLAETEVDHASVYMLEIDEDSRLGRELLAGGARYHAGSAPSEDLAADLYEEAIARLEKAGLRQYEISNFARPGGESVHNRKYWRRQPYLGFGVDAHSFLRRADGVAVRFCSAPSLEEYLAAPPTGCEGLPAGSKVLTANEELEEEWFLGLRLREGVRWSRLAARCGAAISPSGKDHSGGGGGLEAFLPVVEELRQLGLLEWEDDSISLTRRGILLSNDIFARFLGVLDPPLILAERPS